MARMVFRRECFHPCHPCHPWFLLRTIRGILQRAQSENPNCAMKPDPEKIDDAVLALLFLTSFRQRGDELARAWKSHDWEALGRLHAKGMISDPVGKAKSVVLTEEGFAKAEAAFARMFCSAEGAGGA